VACWVGATNLIRPLGCASIVADVYRPTLQRLHTKKREGGAGQDRTAFYDGFPGGAPGMTAPRLEIAKGGGVLLPRHRPAFSPLWPFGLVTRLFRRSRQCRIRIASLDRGDGKTFCRLRSCRSRRLSQSRRSALSRERGRKHDFDFDLRQDVH